MTITDIDTHVAVDIVLQLCPLCGAVLDAESVHILCPDCEADEAAKWADYCAEQEQAWLPY